MISISSLLALAVGLYAISYHLLSNANRNSAPVATGDPILQFDSHLGFRGNTSAKTQRTFAGGSYEIITDSSGARVSSPEEKTVNASTPITVVGCSFTGGTEYRTKKPILVFFKTGLIPR